MPVSSGIDVYNFGDNTKYLDGTGNYSVPPGASGSPTTAGKGGFWGLSVFLPPTLVANSGNIGGNNQIRAFLFTLPYPTTVAGMAIQIAGTAQTGTVVDVGLYSTSGTGILNSNGSGFGGTGFDGTSTGVKSKTFARVTVAAGQYYLAWTGVTTGTLSSVSYTILAGNANTQNTIAATINGFGVISSDAATSGILPSSLTIAHLSAAQGDDPPATWFAT